MGKHRGTKKNQHESQKGENTTQDQNEVGASKREEQKHHDGEFEVPRDLENTQALKKAQEENGSSITLNFRPDKPEERDGCEDRSGVTEESLNAKPSVNGKNQGVDSGWEVALPDERQIFEKRAESEPNEAEKSNSENFSTEREDANNEDSKILENNDTLPQEISCKENKSEDKPEDNCTNKMNQTILQDGQAKKEVDSSREDGKKLELYEAEDVKNEKDREDIVDYIIKLFRGIFSSDTKTAEDGGEVVYKHMFAQETLHNLFAVLFGAAGFYAVLTNYFEIGFIFRLPHHIASVAVEDTYILKALIVLFCIPLYHFINLGIEIMLLHEKFTERIATIAYLFNISLMLTFPIAFFRYVDETNILCRLTLLTLYVYTYMKSSSFWSWNYSERIKWKRRKAKASKDPKYDDPETDNNVSYPHNLNFWNVLRFSVVPCYCYKPDYPRRPPSVQRILTFVAVCCAQAEVSVNLVDHILLPVQERMFVEEHGFYNWKSYRQFVDEMRIVILLSPVFGLAAILFLNALLYGILNFLAEISSFDHNGFCGDWWNAADIKGYWNTWNYPVHDYLRDHVYIPCRRRGFGNFESNMIAFFLSGVFHDYAMGGIMGIYSLWATSSMSFQALNIEICEVIRKRYGNYGRRFTNLLVIQAWPLGASAIFTYLYKLKTEG